MAAATTEELERFRRKWQEEVNLRGKGKVSIETNSTATSDQKSSVSDPARFPAPFRKTHTAPYETQDDWESSSHDLENPDAGHELGESGNAEQVTPKREPASALEHYERAVERESEGSLGDSLKHYRKAYRLDAGVDKAYKKKYFPNPPPTVTKIASPNPSNVPVTVPNTAHHSLTDAHISVSELIATFANISIPQEEAPTDGSPEPPCPIATIPSEILTQIVLQTAMYDPASFVRLSLTCKRLAYVVATDDRIWKYLCSDREHGFAAMHYNWACGITGQSLPQSIDNFDRELHSITSSKSVPRLLKLSNSYPTYRFMYHARPRIRFAGCYISTVNYIRPGAAAASQATWNSPVFIVTYYRYLRFFKDGSCISLLTTAEPVDVVHHLLKINMGKNHAQGLPSAVMNHALRGRWRLSGNPWLEKVMVARDAGGRLERDYHACTGEEGEEEEEEGIVHIETEGADAGSKNPKYVYKMMLQLQSAGGAKPGKTRNNKMTWLGYWSYNKLSDDWAEFGLKNDKPFFWSRVRSYGTGE